MSELDPADVDGTRPVVLSDDGATLLLPTTATGTWCFADLRAPTAHSGSRPILTVLRSRRPLDGGDAVTTGGVLIAQIDLLAVIPPPDRIASWSAQLRSLGAQPLVGDRFRFVPLRLRQGRMRIQAADGVLVDPQEVLEIGATASVVVTAVLSAAGADTVAAAVEAGAGPPVGVDVELNYDLAVPECSYRVAADVSAVHGVLAAHRGGLAPCLGQIGRPEEWQELVAELRRSNAVAVRWLSRPAGRTDAAITAMESAILQRWVGPAAAVLGARADPGADPVAVELPPLAQVPDLDAVHDGGLRDIARLRRGADLPLLRDLGPSAVVDVPVDDASMPIVITFPPDDRVARYLCHVEYRTDDGHLTVTAHEASGPAGLVVDERVRWPLATARPALVTVRYAVTWAAADWEILTEVVTLPTDHATIALTVRPGTHVAEVAMTSDLEQADVGSLAAVSWVTQPTAGQERTYSGSVVVEGAGLDGAVTLNTIAFPRPAADLPVRFGWTAELVTPSGHRLVGTGNGM